MLSGNVRAICFSHLMIPHVIVESGRRKLIFSIRKCLSLGGRLAVMCKMVPTVHYCDCAEALETLSSTWFEAIFFFSVM